MLTHAAVVLLRLAGKPARPEVREGDPAEQLLDVAEAEDADLTVCGTRGVSTIQGLLVGSVADRLLKNAQRSVYRVH